MSSFICPVCREKLICDNRTMRCVNMHTFDISRKNYINLLLSNQSGTKRHGDDKLMVKARKAFLRNGYYKPLLDGLCKAVYDNITNDGSFYDTGCGEGYYTDGIVSYLNQHNVSVKSAGIDISKDALSCCVLENKEIELAVASVYKMPFADKSADVILSVFAPFAADEFIRIIKENGVVIRAVPLERHLFGLRKAVYDNPIFNDADFSENGFKIADKISIKYTLSLNSNNDIKNLFMMTPYYYKTSQNDQNKLDALRHLDTEIEFGIYIYKKA